MFKLNQCQLRFLKTTFFFADELLNLGKLIFGNGVILAVFSPKRAENKIVQLNVSQSLSLLVNGVKQISLIHFG